MVGLSSGESVDMVSRRRWGLILAGASSTRAGMARQTKNFRGEKNAERERNLLESPQKG
jgi:hypothetical protein